MVYVEENGLLTVCDGDAETVVVPEGVVTIGKGAFRDRADLRAVTFPDSLRTIGDLAFEGCRSLTDVEFRHGVRRLGNGCFRDCASIQRVELPESLTSIHTGAFENCSGLEQVALPASLRRNIEARTFARCLALKKVVVPSGIQQIKRRAFLDCAALETVAFQNEEVLIDSTAFDGCERLDEGTRGFIQSHVMKDDTIDINSRAPGAAGRLSNYTERHFTFDGIECRSLEGVLQSLKCPDPGIQREICLLVGGWAKLAAREFDWRADQTLYWRGKPYPRRSEEYGKLLDRLYDAAFEQDAAFRADLASLRGQRIDHRMGLTNAAETVLTRMEFVRELQRLIERTV